MLKSSSIPDNSFDLPSNGRRRNYLWLARPSFQRNRQGAVRLLTLILLRWMALLGQTITLVIIHNWMSFSLPLVETLGVVVLSAVLNIGLSIRYKSTRWLSVRGAFLNLGYDTIQLAVLLYFTGGLANPFCLLFLVPVTVSATILTRSSTAGLYALAIACITVLAMWQQPLPWTAVDMLTLPATYILGIWIALAFGMAFISGYVSLVVNEAQSMGDALQATQMALERERRVAEIGALAAAAAHELGTPLNTMRILISELEEELESRGDQIAEDLQALIIEVDRCKQILDGIARDDKQANLTPLTRLSPAALLEDIAAPYRSLGKIITVSNQGGPSRINGVTIERSPEVVHAIGVLVENAVDFAAKKVTLTASCTQQHVVLDVEDDGPGIPADIRRILGQPYVSGRVSEETGSGKAVIKHAGMGLGIFIARTLLERTGGALSFNNRSTGGAHARVVWYTEDLKPDAEDATPQHILHQEQPAPIA